MEKIYTCICGKEFTNSRSFNGHKTHCEQFQLQKYGSLDKLLAAQAQRSSTHSNRCAEKRKIREEQQISFKKLELEHWISEQHICETCGKIMTEKFGSGRFCSRSCANKRQISDDHKNKVSNSLIKFYNEVENEGRVCDKCGNIFFSKDINRKSCYICKPKFGVKSSKEPNYTNKNLLELSKRTISKIIRRMQLPCSCCGAYVEGVVWDLHHIIPHKKGGTDDLSNVTYICPNCHRIAHTDVTKLVHPLIALDDFLDLKHKQWKDFYFE